MIKSNKAPLIRHHARRGRTPEQIAQSLDVEIGKVREALRKIKREVKKQQKIIHAPPLPPVVICQWPIHDTDYAMFICGAPTIKHSPYCEAHHTMGYLSSKKRAS